MIHIHPTSLRIVYVGSLVHGFGVARPGSRLDHRQAIAQIINAIDARTVGEAAAKAHSRWDSIAVARRLLVAADFPKDLGAVHCADCSTGNLVSA